MLDNMRDIIGISRVEEQVGNRKMKDRNLETRPIRIKKEAKKPKKSYKQRQG